MKPCRTIVQAISKPLSNSLDAVLIDYAISSIRDQQSDNSETAVDHIRNLKMLRDQLNHGCKCKDFENCQKEGCPMLQFFSPVQ